MKNLISLQKRFIGYFATITVEDTVEGLYYIVGFPDLEGCFSQGNSLEEALCRGREALAIYYGEKRGQLPPASSLDEIRKRNPDSIIQMIALDTDCYIVKPMRTVNKTVTVPEWLNKLSEKYQVNFSQVLRNALIAHLKNIDNISPFDRKLLRD